MATALLRRRAIDLENPRPSDGAIDPPLGDPSDRFQSRRVEPRFKCSEHRFTSADGTALFYRAWRPAAPTGRILVLFHRGHEHSGRWDDVVDALAPEGFTVFAWDARGNGQSEGSRDDAENFGCYAR